ncbi:MAG: hypothetical protein ACFFD4_16545 [Candidatus Odinarchaeota archaeon]
MAFSRSVIRLVDGFIHAGIVRNRKKKGNLHVPVLAPVIQHPDSKVSFLLET